MNKVKTGMEAKKKQNKTKEKNERAKPTKSNQEIVYSSSFRGKNSVPSRAGH